MIIRYLYLQIVTSASERNNPLFVGMKYIPMKRIRARMTIAEVKLARNYTRLNYTDNPLNSVKHSYVSPPDILLPTQAIEALCGC